MNTDGSRLGSAREEAERLVAVGLGVASTALHGIEANRQLRGLAEQVFGSDRMHDLAAGLAGFVSGAGSSSGGSAGHGSAGARPAGGPAAGPASTGFSTGSADCCVCPVCRLIAALRNPSPEFAERLASAAGDVAVGISGFLRVLSGAVPGPAQDADDDPWRAATTATPPSPEKSATEEPAAAPAPAPAQKAATKPAAAPVAKKAAAKKAVAEKAPAKKAVAKKAVRKAVPRDPDDSPA